MSKVHNGGGGEKTGANFMDTFEKKLIDHGIKYVRPKKLNKKDQVIDFIIDTGYEKLYVDCKGQDSQGTAYKVVPTSIHQYVRRYNPPNKKIFIIRGEKSYPSYVINHILDLEMWMGIEVPIMKQDEFILQVTSGRIQYNNYERNLGEFKWRYLE